MVVIRGRLDRFPPHDGPYRLYGARYEGIPSSTDRPIEVFLRGVPSSVSGRDPSVRFRVPTEKFVRIEQSARRALGQRFNFSPAALYFPALATLRGAAPPTRFRFLSRLELKFALHVSLPVWPACSRSSLSQTLRHPPAPLASESGRDGHIVPLSLCRCVAGGPRWSRGSVRSWRVETRTCAARCAR